MISKIRKNCPLKSSYVAPRGNVVFRHASEKTQLLQEINNLKELLNTYEKSIERKDQVISNLTGALQKQKDKHEMMRKFCDWKIKHNDVRREVGFIPIIATNRFLEKLWVLYMSTIMM